jgi:hypothetical protein
MIDYYSHDDVRFDSDLNTVGHFNVFLGKNNVFL